MRRLLLALALVLLAAGCVSMAWPVTCGVTTRGELDARFAQESRALRSEFETAGTCDGRDFVHVQECSRWLNMWRRYWTARDELDRCGGR